ncbi:hypothetical protein R1sor_019210 [Riccia sorocarpa]|uniref:Molybdate transporter 1 n=1 Tax=Riccia sorocarpa TaxID=122646 RepID=A0ABD3IBY0_9MARC
MAPPRENEERSSTPATTIWGRLWSNVRVKGGLWQESSGALGDVGTFLPIVLALALVNGLDLGTTLIFTGLYNIITGLLFGVPMPVQPMKSIAAVAIAEGDPLTVPQIMAAGLSTATVLFLLGVTGLMTAVNRLVPLSVVRGIQLSQGLSFGSKAIKYIMNEQDFKTAKPIGPRPWVGLDGIILALSALLFVVLVTGAGGGKPTAEHGSPSDELPEQSDDEDETPDQETGRSEYQQPLLTEGTATTGTMAPWAKRISLIPSALIVFLVGVIIAVIRSPDTMKNLQWGPSAFSVVRITWDDWKIGFFRAAIPQIPLSVLNSVIAVCKLSNDLFPSKQVTPMAVSSSVGLMNLCGCWFGAMPVCHGAGGLAGQYRFGARKGLSVVILGSAKLLLGLLLGSSLLRLLAQFPTGLLGVLLLFSGAELALACRDQNTRLDAFVMLVVTIVSQGASSAAYGFVSGLIFYFLVKLHERVVGFLAGKGIALSTDKSKTSKEDKSKTSKEETEIAIHSIVRK